MSTHPELAHEQSYIDHAYECLVEMRARVAKLLEAQAGGKTVDEEILRWELRERLLSLGESKAPLTFGRIDEELGDTFYIGRRHVRDETGEPVVVDWRARAAAPFYRATITNAMGLERRRRFVLEGRTLVDMFEEDMTDPDALAQGHGGVPDPLLAELGRARVGQMRDIVATIQGEQDRIIRAPLEECLVVQGGPGTGKTAVGLHRAAFLLYEHRAQLEREKVLIVGPNRLFLEYISEVLPSLGETAVYQTTVDGLTGVDLRARATDPPDTERVKGDIRMARVMRNACWNRVTEPDEPLTLIVRGVRLHLSVPTIRALLKESVASAPSYSAGRGSFLSKVRQELLRERELDLVSEGVDAAEIVDGVLRKGELARSLDAIWPSLGARAVVRDILTSNVKLADAAAGVLSADEQKLMRRRSAKRIREEGWTRGDLALIDEVEALINGSPSQYGHAIVDEAQDLSAMETRMIARRSRGRSMTILGDIAQGTSPSAQSDWADVLRYVEGPSDARIEELSLGYRVPAPILEVANALLPEAAPGVAPGRSVREEGESPRAIRADSLLSATVAEARTESAIWQSVAVIVPEAMLETAAAAFRKEGLDFGTAADAVIDRPITLLTAPGSKGLEFDAVVVVEAAAIMTEPSGARRLYVALTRAVQRLSIVHEADLPPALQPFFRD